MKKHYTLVAVLLFGAIIAFGQKPGPESASHPSLHGGFITNILGNYSTQYGLFTRFQIGSYGDFGYGQFGRLAAMAEIDVFPVTATTRAGIGLKFGSVATYFGMGAFSRTEFFVREVAGDTKFKFFRTNSRTGRFQFDVQVDWRGDLSLANVVNYRGNASYLLTPRGRLEIWGDKALGFGTGWIHQLSTKNNIAALNLRIGTKPVPGADGGNFGNLSVAIGAKIHISDDMRKKGMTWEDRRFAGN